MRFKQCALSKYAPPMILSKLFNDCMISSQCLNAVKTEEECSNHPYLSLETQWECHLVCISEDQCTSMYLTWADFLAKCVFAPYRRFHVTRRVFKQIWHKTWRRWILLHWSRWNPLPLHPELSAHGGSLSFLMTRSFAEAKFYQVEGMINELEPTPSADSIPAVVQLFKDSVILSSSQGQTLMNWLKITPGFSNSDELLLYRASRDGWASSTFHAYCDNKGPTVTVIKSGNNIFGGCTEQSWQSKS